jgi:hypothetical protein
MNEASNSSGSPSIETQVAGREPSLARPALARQRTDGCLGRRGAADWNRRLCRWERTSRRRAYVEGLRCLYKAPAERRQQKERGPRTDAPLALITAGDIRSVRFHIHWVAGRTASVLEWCEIVEDGGMNR